MNLTRLILMVHEDCNFFCQYCYQTKEKKQMDWKIAKKSLDFFFNQKPDTYGLYFLGGEPLLNYPLIKDTVNYIKEKISKSKKKVYYNISTNGSLITDEVLEFFNKYQFTVELSFDGLAQNKSRKKGSFDQILSVINLLKNQSNITLHINSVFFPASVDLLSRSVDFILDLGVPHFHLSLATDNLWNPSSIKKLEQELSKAREIILNYNRKTGNLPINFFSLPDEKGIWNCTAAQNQMTVSAEGEVWGCPLFYEYFKDKRETEMFSQFYIGNIQDFINNYKKKYPEILENYKQLSMDNCFTEDKRCFLCSDVEKCEVCPVISKNCLATENEIPSYICQIKKMIFQEQEKFTQAINTI